MNGRWVSPYDQVTLWTAYKDGTLLEKVLDDIRRLKEILGSYISTKSSRTKTPNKKKINLSKKTIKSPQKNVISYHLGNQLP